MKIKTQKLNKKIKSLEALLSKHHFLVSTLALLCIALFLSRGWLNPGFPKGNDIMGATLYSPSLQNPTMSGWSLYWYIGSPIVWTPSTFLSGIFMAPEMGYNIFCLLIFVFAGVFTYLFVREITKNSLASFLSAILYTFIPYHLALSIFAGLGGHSVVYSLTPLVFFLIEKNSKSNSRTWTIFAGFAIAALILSNPQAVVLIGPFVFAYCLFKTLKRPSPKNFRMLVKKEIAIFAPLIIGLLVSAYWWFPMIFERGLFHSMEYSLESTIPYTYSFFELITFRLSGINIPATFGIEGIQSFPVLILRLFIPIFALSALIFFRRNRYVLFFSITSLIAITLGMGVSSPIPLFTFTFEHIPFFDGIRTPSRFLMFASFAFSVLAGFASMKLLRVGKSRANLANLFVAGLIILAIIGPVYGESREAFQTFELNPSQRGAMSWLSKQEGGRLVPLPWATWVDTPETGCIISPWNYVHLHEKEVVRGGAPIRALQNTANLLEIFRPKLYNEKISSVELMDILGVKYIVLDGNYPKQLPEERFNIVYADLESSDDFEKVWSENNVIIFKNLNAFPRIFVLKESEFKQIDVFEENTTFVWRWAEGTQHPANLSWDEEIVLDGNRSLQSTYEFTKEGRDWLNISVSVENINFDNYDVINFWYYLPEPQPDIRFGISVFEEDGSRYTARIPMDTTPGWHKVAVPFALLWLAYSEDQNRQLDINQIASLWIGVSETGNYEENKVFTIYFDNMILSRYKYVVNEVSFELIHPGKYKVNVNVNKPAYVVLTESYHPQWVAKDLATGEVVAKSEPLFIALNGFWLKEGEYELILEYEESLPHKIGTICSILTLIACLGYFAKDLIQKLLQMMSKSIYRKKRFKNR